MDTETPDTLSVIAIMWVVSCSGTLASAKAPNLIHHKMEYSESPHCLSSNEELWVCSEDCGRM